jgi:hypothetical protein
MKKLHTILLIFLISFTNFSFSQNWCASGALWYYTYTNFTFDGYVKIEKVGDTTINTFTCDILQKTLIGYNYISSTYDTTSLGREYTRLSNDTVYNFRSGQFYVLYCFNAVPGDTWLIAGNNINCALTDTISVDSIGTTVINSTTLKYIWTSPTSANGWRFTNRIIEKIGCIGYMFPEPFCLTDINEGGPFRCYNDSSGWSYQTGIAPYCDYTTAVSEYSNQNIRVSIFPNPFTTKTTIALSKTEGDYIFRIFNELGCEVLINSDFKKEVILSDISFANGFYFWTLSDQKNKIISSGKLIKY